MNYLKISSLASQPDFSHAHALAGKNGLGTPAQNPGILLEPIRLQDSRDVFGAWI